MKKRVLAMLLATSMVFTLAACGGSSESSSGDGSSENAASADSGSGETYDLQVISKGLNNSWMNVVKEGVEAAGAAINEEAGYQKVNVSYVGPESQSDIAVQVQQLADAISSGADVIGLGALDEDSVSDLMDEAAEKGIPVITWASDIDGKEAVKSFVATNSYAAAAEGADQLYDKIKDRITGDEQVKVGMLSWSSVAQDHVERGAGFLDQFISRCSEDGKTVAVTGNEKFVAEAQGEVVDEKDADVVIEVRVPSQTTSELASTEAGVLLNQDNMIGIFANTQDVAEGVLTANENLGKLGVTDDDIIFVGFDAGEVQEAAVLAGIEYGAVNQAVHEIGYQLVETMLKAAEGEEVEDIETPYIYYNADNINDEEVQQNFY